MIKMTSAIRWFSTLAFMTLALATASKSQATEEWQVVVLRQQDSEVLTQHKLAYPAIEQAITAALLDGNIEVTDQTLLLDKEGRANTGQLTDKALYQANPDDINLAIRYQLSIFPQTSAVVKKWRFELSAFLVDLQTKKKIESQLSQQVFSDQPLKCGQTCLQGWIAFHAQQMAQEVGAILVEKLQNLPRRYRYQLMFQNFTSDELAYLVQQLKLSPGFVHATLLEEFASKQVLLHRISGRKYRYISHLPADDLDLLLLKILAQGGIDAQNEHGKDKQFVLTRSKLAYQARYISAFIIVLVLIVVLLLGYYRVRGRWQKKVHHRKLAQGHELLASAKKMSDKQGKQALTMLAQARQLNPDLAPEITHLRQQIKNKQDEDAGLVALSQAKLALDKQDYYQAYSKIDEFFHHHNPLSKELDDLVQQLKSCRVKLDSKVVALQGVVEGQQALAGCFLFTENSLFVGRNKGADNNSFSIDFKRLSRSGKQCEFRYQAPHFYVSDQGSSNGSFLDGKALAPKHWVVIRDGQQLTLGGLAKDSRFGICQFELGLSSNSEQGALMLSLNPESINLLSHDNLALAWPKMNLDLASRWILLTKPLALGINAKGLIDIGCLDGADACAYLLYEECFYIEPVVSDIVGSQVKINQQVVYAKLPITHHAQLSINGQEFSLQ